MSHSLLLIIAVFVVSVLYPTAWDGHGTGLWFVSAACAIVDDSVRLFVWLVARREDAS